MWSRFEKSRLENGTCFGAEQEPEGLEKTGEKQVRTSLKQE